MITFRIAKVEDASRILEIYAYYVENTAVSFLSYCCIYFACVAHGIAA